MMATENDFVLAVGIGAAVVVAIAAVTAPLWVPRLFGETPKRCRCGAEISPSGVATYCQCDSSSADSQGSVQLVSGA